jgi:hypothetical protein
MGQICQQFWWQSRAAFAQIIFEVLMAKIFDKNPQKCGAQCERCSLKFAVKFQQKC